MFYAYFPDFPDIICVKMKFVVSTKLSLYIPQNNTLGDGWDTMFVYDSIDFRPIDEVVQWEIC